MKKITLAIALLMAVGMGSAKAQWSHFGAKLGLGYATYVDDLVTKGGVLGANLGGFAEYGFTESNSFLLENVSLQFGLNFTRRGYSFEEVYQKDAMMSLDYGKLRAWYAQLYALGRYQYELPVPEAGHYLVLSLGPGFSFGMFGRYRERKISPRMPQQSMNFDTYTTEPKSAKRTFTHIRRPDVDFLASIGYCHNEWQVDLMLDYGFLAVTLADDRVRLIEEDQVETYNATHDDDITVGRTKVPEGNNLALMLSLTYRIPFVNR